MRAFLCWPSHDCEGAFPTRSVDNETEILAVVPYINGVFWISISLFSYYFISKQQQQQNGVFLYTTFLTAICSAILCVRKCIVIPSSCIGKTP